MIYITGDLHGDERREMIPLIEFEKAHHFTKDDILIICGDFGFIWSDQARTSREYFILQKLQEHLSLCLDYFESAPWTTVFVDGNHECFPRLYSFPQKTWMGGHVHEVRKHVYHLMRGELYNIQGTTVFTMGGAQSTDRAHRIAGYTWWEEEMPSDEEYAHARKTLEQLSSVDLIITHCAPTHLEKRYFHRAPNKLTDFLEEISQQITFRHWYFGHYHETKDFDDHYTCLYKEVRMFKS